MTGKLASGLQYHSHGAEPPFFHMELNHLFDTSTDLKQTIKFILLYELVLCKNMPELIGLNVQHAYKSKLAN